MPDVRLFRIASGAKWHPFQGGADIDTGPTMSFAGTTPSGVWGGGFQNTGAIHPTDPNLWLVGGDVAGVHLSSDAGMTWAPNNTGLDSSQKMHGVAVRWSETDPYLAYYFSAAPGAGNANNFLFSGRYDPTVGGIVRWTVIKQLTGAWCAVGIGPQAGDTLADGDGHPRESKRRMLALDEANGLIYAGSADGLWRVRLDGTGTPTRVWGAGQSITSISLDPQDRTTAFVTVDLGTLSGVNRLVGVHTGTSPTVSTYRPTDLRYAQSLKAVVKSGVTRLFVASGKGTNAATPTGSAFYWAGGSDLSAGWTDLSGNLNADETAGGASLWSGIDVALLSGGAFRILITHSHNAAYNGKKVAWVDWTSGTPTWSKPGASTADAAYRVGDTAGATWWFTDTYPILMLDRSGFDCVDPCIAPSNPDLWMAPGRSGLWRRNVTGPVSTMWHPAVKGTAVTTSQEVLVSNRDPLKVAFGDTDWTFLRSTDGMVTQPTVSNLPNKGNGWAMGQAEGTGRFVIGLGSRDSNTGGYLYCSGAPWSTINTWVEELRTGTGGPWSSPATTPQVKGVAIGVDGTGTQIILAAMRAGAGAPAGAGGLWRKVGAGSAGKWSECTLSPYTGTVFSTTTNAIRQRFAWKPGGGPTVWLNDPLSGLWQSRDYGETWSKFYAATWTTPNSGGMVGDPTRAGVYYATTEGGKSWRISNGDGASPTKAPMNPGATKAAFVVVHPTSGNLYLAESGVARLWKSTDGGTTWSDLTTPSWEAMCATVKALAIGSNGVLYTAMFAGYAITDLE